MRPRWNAARFQLVVERTAERLTRTRQTRHHRANGDPHHVSKLSVGETFELAEDEELMRTIGPGAQGATDQRGVIDLKQ